MYKYLLRILFGFLPICFIFSSNANAKDYPKEKPINFLVGFQAGGSTDIIARLLSTKLKEILGQSIIVENKPGFNGAIAAEALVRSPADGYTLLACTNGILTTQSYFVKNLRFDPDKDILPVMQFALIPYILVTHPSLKVNNISEFISLAKKESGNISYGSSGVGGGGHLAASIFSSKVNINMKHIPYKGSGQVIVDLVSGQINSAFDQEAAISSFINSNKIKPLAIASKDRSPNLPNVPTFTEAGIPFESASWTAVCMHAETPQKIVDKVQSAFVKVMMDPEIKNKFQQMGLFPRSVLTNELKNIIRNDREILGKAILDLGISKQ